MDSIDARRQHSNLNMPPIKKSGVRLQLTSSLVQFQLTLKPDEALISELGTNFWFLVVPEANNTSIIVLIIQTVFDNIM